MVVTTFDLHKVKFGSDIAPRVVVHLALAGPPTHSTIHWPENQTVPISPNSDLPFLPTEKPAFAHTNDPALSQQAQRVEQQPDNPFLRTPSPFCLEAIPIELQNQMTSGLRHPIRIYPLPAEHA
ncbi:hypothetical protein BKA62DRAFT_678186 [Auriculariales sp. MPI-PUGE-AT-0066]|nr:hypothetical protein BKA62DRAFT_678186 [Auriculariales sp. MPI-PUGE-AT-0066]